MEKNNPMKKIPQHLSIIQLTEMFPDDEAAERWFEEQRWPGGRRVCPTCSSTHTAEVKNRHPMPYHCRDCREYFSVRKGTVMERSRIGPRKWIIAMYMLTTRVKGVSSIQIHKELEIRPATAWTLMHKIREGYVGSADEEDMPGPVEVDETYIGGKFHNMTAERVKKMREKYPGRGPVGKQILAGIKDRATNRVCLEHLPDNRKRTLQPFVCRNVEPGTQVYTDDLKSYNGLPYPHGVVRHSIGEYADGDAHINGMESFWALFKRGYHGVYHKMSPKHQHRYAAEFEGRFNSRDLPTVERLSRLVCGMFGRRLRYADLIKDNGKESGAREVAGPKKRERVRI